MGIIFPNSSVETKDPTGSQPFLVASKLYPNHISGAYVLDARDPSNGTSTITSAGYIQWGSWYYRRSTDTFSPVSDRINILQDGIYFAFFKGLLQGSSVENRYVRIQRNNSASNPTEIRVYSSNGSEDYHTFCGGGMFKCYRGDWLSVYNQNTVLFGSSGYTTFQVIRI